ncbi:threonine synthase, partial [candidate division WOR-3 bacterium]
PVVSAFDNGEKEVKAWPRWPETSAVGLAVPRPPGGSQLLNLLRETKGRAIAVTEQEIKEAVNTVARSEGILLSPEGGVAFAALKILTEEGWIRRGERVVIINTASGMLCHRGER